MDQMTYRDDSVDRSNSIHGSKSDQVIKLKPLLTKNHQLKRRIIASKLQRLNALECYDKKSQNKRNTWSFLYWLSPTGYNNWWTLLFFFLYPIKTHVSSPRARSICIELLWIIESAFYGSSWVGLFRWSITAQGRGRCRTIPVVNIIMQSSIEFKLNTMDTNFWI